MSTPATPAARASVAAAKGGKRLPAILGSSLLLLGAGGYVGYARLAGGTRHAATPAQPALELEGGVVEVEPFVMNLADPAGDRFLRLSVSLVLDRKSIAARVETGLAEVKLRDRLLSVLSKKRASEVVSAEGKERLRQELIAAVEALLAEPPFHDAQTDPARAHALDVLFTEFLVQ